MSSSDSFDDATELSPAAHDASASDDRLNAGARVGRYVIGELLGEGGMGRVYRATQTAPVQRPVALKLIREQLATPLALAYFEVERQALARMHHPAIAQVLDAGNTDDGRAFLAMELVEGESLTRFCEQHALSLDARLSLFIQVCHGVQHAHQKGVIHRDLKPANVLVRMVDGTPAPKIIDFGIAVGAGGSGVGESARAVQVERAGTAIYMSPEQHENDERGIDTRSDVYSLGVMLLELLAKQHVSSLTSGRYQSRHSTRGRRDDASALTISPVQAVDQATSLPRELRAILSMSMATDRTERYESAAALAEDLQRYRDRTPVRALPPKRSYHLRKFVSRHRLGISTASIAVSAVVIGASLAVISRNDARQAAAQAQIEAQKSTQVAAFVTDMLSGIDPDRARGLDRSLLNLLLDSAAKRAEKELAGQPQVATDVQQAIAKSYASIGDYPRAVVHYGLASEAARNAEAPMSAQGVLLINQATILGNSGDLPGALRLGEEALVLVQGLPEDDRGRLRVESRLAWQKFTLGQIEQSSRDYARILKLQQRALGENDPDTLDSQRGLASAYTRMGRFAEAQPLLEHSLAQLRELYGESHSRSKEVTLALAILLMEQDKFAEAETLLVPLLAMLERDQGPDHPNTLSTVSNLGSALKGQGRLQEARPYYERALSSQIRIQGESAPFTLFAQNNFARFLLESGEVSAAGQHVQIAINQMDRTFGAENPLHAVFLETQASVLIAAEHYAEAERILDRAYALATDKGSAAIDPRTMDMMRTYIKLYTNWDRADDAADWQKRLQDAEATGPGTSS